MLTAKDFEERYKVYSNAQLLEILDSPAKYQGIAITAARNELHSRNLLKTEIDEARQLLETKKQARNVKKESTDQLMIKVNSAGNAIYDTLNPINTGSYTVSKSIALIILVYSLLFCYSLFSQLDDLSAYVSADPFEFVYFAITVLPMLLLLISLLLLGFKKKDGWKLFLFYCGFTLISIFFSLYQYLKSLFADDSFYFFAPPSPLAIIIAFLFYGSTIYALSKANVMAAYNVNKQHFRSYLISGLVVGTLFHLVVLL